MWILSQSCWRAAFLRLPETTLLGLFVAGVAPLAGRAQSGAPQPSGETKRLEARLSQNILVLLRQNELATAKGVELQALIAYRKSIINLQQAL
jgi:hypothetical protein